MKLDDAEEEKIEEEAEEKALILHLNETSDIVSLNNSYLPKIKNLLEFIITQNNINKNYKFSLFKIRGFNPDSIFNEIDTISSGFINDKDLEEYLNKYNIKIEQEILNLFIRQFNKGKDKNLWKKDFLNFMNFGIIKGEKNLGELSNYNKEEINKNFLNLIKSEFELIKNQNKLINEIIQLKEFSTYEAFNIISSNKNYIELSNLKEFLGNKFQENEIKELIYRIDLNGDKKICYEEFQDLFFPFQSHLHLDLDEEEEEEKNENEYFIQNKYYFDLNMNKNLYLSSPNIIDKHQQNLNESEIKININDNINNKINDSNEINYGQKNEFNDEDLIIKYDENLINEIIQNNDNKNENYENYNTLLLKCESDKIKACNMIKDPSPDNYNNKNLIIEKGKEKNDENRNNLKGLNPINNINIDENKKDILSKSEILLSNKVDINNFSLNNRIQIDYLTEKDKDIVRLFIDYIHSIILLENISENIKESISLSNDISFIDIFNIFNKDKDGLISKKNFIKICEDKFYIYPKEKQIKLVFDRYDLDNDTILNEKEFMKMICPLKEEYITINQEKSKNRKDKNISFGTKEIVIELFKRLIENESLIYDWKLKLKNDKNFNFVFLWEIIMKFSHDGKKVNKKEFNCFLENFQCFLTNYELNLIFYKFAMGKDEIKYDSLYKEIITYDY